MDISNLSNKRPQREKLMNGELSILKSEHFVFEKKLINGFFSSYPKVNCPFIFFTKDESIESGTLLMVFNHLTSVKISKVDDYLVYKFSTFEGSYELSQKILKGAA